MVVITRLIKKTLTIKTINPQIIMILHRKTLKNATELSTVMSTHYSASQSKHSKI